MRNFKTEAIIIKRKNFGEADRLLTVFTRKMGKIIIKAIGVRRITSRRASHVELLNYSKLTLYTGRNLAILTEAETLKDFSKIKSDLTKVGFAYHICELIDGLCPEGQENSEIFALLNETFERLSKEDEISTIIHDFEIALLTNLGFYPNNYPKEKINTTSFIEKILERKLKSKQIISKLN